MARPVCAAADEGDTSHAGIGDERVSHVVAHSGDHVDHARREDVDEIVDQGQDRQGGELARLQHDGVARDQRRRYLRDGEHERMVEGDDASGHSERLAQRVVQSIVSDRNRLASGHQGKAGEVPHLGSRDANIIAHLPDGAAVVGCVDGGQFIPPPLDDVGQPQQGLRPRERGLGGPPRERALRLVDCVLHVAHAAPRERCDELSRCRVVRLEGWAPAAQVPLATDQGGQHLAARQARTGILMPLARPGPLRLESLNAGSTSWMKDSSDAFDSSGDMKAKLKSIPRCLHAGTAVRIDLILHRRSRTDDELLADELLRISRGPDHGLQRTSGDLRTGAQPVLVKHLDAANRLLVGLGVGVAHDHVAKAEAPLEPVRDDVLGEASLGHRAAIDVQSLQQLGQVQAGHVDVLGHETGVVGGLVADGHPGQGRVLAVVGAGHHAGIDRARLESRGPLQGRVPILHAPGGLERSQHGTEVLILVVRIPAEPHEFHRIATAGKAHDRIALRQHVHEVDVLGQGNGVVQGRDDGGVNEAGSRSTQASQVRCHHQVTAVRVELGEVVLGQAHSDEAGVGGPDGLIDAGLDDLRVMRRARSLRIDVVGELHVSNSLALWFAELHSAK